MGQNLKKPKLFAGIARLKNPRGQSVDIHEARHIKGTRNLYIADIRKKGKSFVMRA